MSQPPKPLEFGISQASILDIYERTTALTVAQMELRNQTLSDAELAEFELSLQNWVIEYLWPAPKPVYREVPPEAVRYGSRTFVIKVGASQMIRPLPFTKRAWELTMQHQLDSLAVMSPDQRLLKQGVDYILRACGRDLHLIIPGASKGEIIIIPKWDDPEAPGGYEILNSKGQLGFGYSILFS